ncbi:MAG: amidohydrolase family protein [Caldilineaceae bacterium SB0662_bin_9]|uniref:Amidohydrolase family protein n=1 Tax=Caldilineaceae bacterium SB0662_bin_9 TaxID=2605258 RepID=A0A6B1DYL4_9CHLR|nr:amidohydrolase family protein [Caldilineaceae bacterium SB0662_bin_9]
MALCAIDTDIHAVVPASSIEPRLPQPWKLRFSMGDRGPGSLGYWNPNGVMRRDAVAPDGRRVEGDPHLLARHFFDVHDLEYGILNFTGPALNLGLSPDPLYAAAVATAANDAVVEEWLPVDNRFYGSITVTPNNPEAAAAEIRRLGHEERMPQVLMVSGARMPMGQAWFHPIYEACAEVGKPIAIHPGSEGVGISGPPTAVGYPTNYLEWHTDLVGSYIGHLVSMVTEGVFVKYPDLKFVLIEGGVSWLPPILWRLDKNWKALRQTAPWLERPPSEYVYEHVLLTTQPIEEPEPIGFLHQMLAMFPAEHMLMFATDFPHWDNDMPDFTARLIPEHLRRNVMSETARRLYRLPAPAAMSNKPGPTLLQVSEQQGI